MFKTTARNNWAIKDGNQGFKDGTSIYDDLPRRACVHLVGAAMSVTREKN